MIPKDTLRRTRLMARRIKHPQYDSNPEFRIKGDLVFDIDSGYPFLKFDNVYLKVPRDWAEQAMHEAQSNAKEIGQ